MSLPVQLGDIKVIVDLIIWFQDRCLDPKNQANIKYNELKDCVERFNRALVQLHQLADRAVWSPGLRATASKQSRTGRSFDIGDYETTLRQCKVFLEKHKEVGLKKPSKLGNGRWALKDNEVQAFRDRINDHYLAAAVQITVQLCHNAQKSRQPSLAVELQPLPSAWQETFREAICLDDSVSIEDIIRSLHRRMNKSEQFHRDSRSQRQVSNPASNYLHVLLAQYLLEVAEQSPAYKAQPIDSALAEDVLHARQLISQRRSSFAVEPSDAELQAEWSKDRSFLLNPEDDTTLLDLPSQSSVELEKELLRLTLSSSGDTTDELAVARVSDEELHLKRIVSRPGSTNSEGARFRLHEDKFIPWYTLNPQSGISIKPAPWNGEEISVKSRKDKIRLQKAFTGYSVQWPRDDPPKVVLDISKRFLSKPEVANGELQLWNWPLPKPGRDRSSSLSPMSSVLSSNLSSPMSTATSFAQTLSPSIFSYQENGTGTGGVVSGHLPPAPLLMAFTRSGERTTSSTGPCQYQIWRIDCKPNLNTRSNELTSCLVTKTYIDQSPDGQKYTVIKSKNKDNDKKLQIRRLSKAKAQVDSWNLCTISLPNHPHFNDEKVVERLEATFVQLNFPSVTQRDTFNRYLRSMLELRSAQEKALEKAFEDAMRQGNSINHIVTSYGS